MASLSLFVLVLSTLLAATGGFLIGPEELSGWVNVSHQVIATTISDYYAVINDGTIVAFTLNLTGPLNVVSGDLGNLKAANTTSDDLTALNTTTPTASIGILRTTGNATFHSSVTVDGELVVKGRSWLGDLDVTSLTSTQNSTVNGLLFAEKNLQVTRDTTVNGNVRIFGDALFNSSLNLGQNLTVHDQAQILHDLLLQNQLHTLNLTVDGQATLGHLGVSGWVNVSGSAWAGRDVFATNGNFGGSLAAHDVQITENWNGKGLLNVNGYLSTVKLTSLNGSFNVNANENINSSLTVDGSASLGSLKVQRDLNAGVNVTSAATLTAVDGMFDTLSVDTGTIQTLTSTFVTANNLVGTDVTVANSFISGVTTLSTLVVEGSTTLTTATANSIAGQTIVAGNATSASLTVSGHGEFVNVQVKTLITAGTPTQTNYFGAFDIAYSNDLKFVNLVGTNGNISDIFGDRLTYTTIQGVNLDLKFLTAQSAVIENAQITNATITNLLSESSTIDTVLVNVMDYTTLVAERGTISRVDARNTRTEWVNATNSEIGTLTALTIQTNNLVAAQATVVTLEAQKAWSDTWTSSTGSFTNLWSTTTTATDLSGNSLTYTTGSISELASTTGISKTFDVKQSATASWVWAREANFSTFETKSLRVTNSGWLQNATVHQDLWVQGETTLQNGTLSAQTVLSNLDVVGTSDLLGGLSSTESSFFTDLSVKRVTITDTFQANSASLGSTTLDLLQVTNQTVINGFLNATKDSSLGGNLVVVGTTQFQTGSFTRIGTALITTTDMEAFNMNVAEGTFGDITTGDFNLNRAAEFERSISLAPLLGDISGAAHSLFIQIAPTTFSGTSGGKTFDVNTLAYLHTGNSSIDALVVSSAADPSVAALRFRGDGSIDLMDGDVNLNNFNIAGGVVLENEANIAWPTGTAAPSLVLTQGGQGAYYTYSQLQDRDLVAPGSKYNPSRFHAPTGSQDLLTLTAGHYRVSGTVYFTPAETVNTSFVAVAVASVSGWLGTQSNLSVTPEWTTSCVANFNLVASSSWGGSCSFQDVLVVDVGETITLRTSASWPFSSVASTQKISVSSKSSVQVAEYFERVSQGLSA